MKVFITANKHKIEITNPDKILFPQDKITKRELVEYYKKISSFMLPLIKNRAITMHRYPNGIHEEGFYHKDAPEHFPGWIKILPVESATEKKIVHYIVINNVATLLYVANYGCVTPHPWLSKIDKPDYPDRIIFDLDPSNEKSFSLICKKAKEMKKLLNKIGFNAFVMTTGSRGLHIIIPIIRKYNFDVVKEFSRKIAEYFVETDPEHLTLEIRKNKRGNKIFVDFLRNGYGATAVAPYAVRAKDGAPVATPLFWEELDNPKLTSQKYNINNVFQKLNKMGDPWKNINKYAKSINIK